MDTITHALLGLAISEATLRRRVGRSANWLAGAAAVIPDADAWLNFDHDPWSTLLVHRGATHALVLIPVLAAAIAAAFWLVRRRQFAAMFLLAALAVASHQASDLITSYGTQLFWPFSHARLALDVLPIVDIIFTPILALALIAAWIARRRGARKSQAIALVGLLLAGGYAAVGAWADARTRQIALATAPADHGPAVSVRSTPLLGTVFARRLIVKTDHGFHLARYNLLLAKGPPQWRWAPSDDGRFVRLADRLDRVRLFRWFAMGMARPAVEQTFGDGRMLVRVSYYDMRYGYPADSDRSIFAAYVILDGGTGEVLAGPVSPRWTGREHIPEGLAAFFDQPVVEPMARRGWWARLGEMWSEAFKP